MRIGAHVDPADPLAEAAARKADVVQFFLADPQGWKNPQPRADAQALKDSDLQVFIHAPYIVNVASPNNRIRIPSRKLMQVHAEAAATVGASGLIVHGGHVDKGDLADGFDNWRKALEQHKDTGVPILIENTAGGDNACARKFDALAQLWDTVGDLERRVLPRHLPRARRRRGSAQHCRPGEGHHRTHRPRSRQRLKRWIRLWARSA